jgi:hypothetical protein
VGAKLMIKTIALLLMLVTNAFAGLPPTNMQGANDASPVTTFFSQTPWINQTHVGVTTNYSSMTDPLFQEVATPATPAAGYDLLWFNGGVPYFMNSSGTPTTLYPSFTPGSVIFAGATGALAQDNSNFFWDDTNHGLKIEKPSSDASSSTVLTVTSDPSGTHGFGHNIAIDGNPGGGGWIFRTDGGLNKSWIEILGGPTDDGTTGGQIYVNGVNSTDGDAGGVQFGLGYSGSGPLPQYDFYDYTVSSLLFSISNAGVVNVPQITASNVVGTDASHNLTPVGQLSSTDASGNTIPIRSSGSFNVATPTSSSQVANKGYVDTVAAQLAPAQSVYAASTANLAGTYVNGVACVGATLTATATGTLTVDGVNPPLNSRVLLKSQTTAAQGGVYTVTNAGGVGINAVLTRATDNDTAADLNAGNPIPVVNGTANATTSWLQTATIVTCGTDSTAYTEWTYAPGMFVMKSGDTMTGPLVVPAGTVSAPGLAVGATGSGLYESNTNEISMTNNGVQTHIWKPGNGGENFVNPNGSYNTFNINYGPGETWFRMGSNMTLIDGWTNAPGTYVFLGWGAPEGLTGGPQWPMHEFFKAAQGSPSTFTPGYQSEPTGYGYPIHVLANLDTTAGDFVGTGYQGSNTTGTHSLIGYDGMTIDTQASGSGHGAGTFHWGADNGTTLTDRMTLNGSKLHVIGDSVQFDYMGAGVVQSDASGNLTSTAFSGGATVNSSGVVTLTNSSVTGQALTGFSSTTGTVTAADSILTAIEKLVGNAIAGNAPIIKVESGNYTVLSTDNAVIFTATATATLPDCTGLTNDWTWQIKNMSQNGIVTITPGGSNTFTTGPQSGLTTFQLTDPGANVEIDCNEGSVLYVSQ